MRGLQDKVIVVCAGGTGAGPGTGLGGATALRLGEEGAKVVVADIDEAAAKRSAEAIVAAGGTAIAVGWDAADEEQTRQLMGRAADELGGIDGLHYNAMDMSQLQVDGDNDLLTLPIEVLRRSLDVGLTGFVLAARHAVPSMLERGGGSIVCTASLAAYIGEPVRLAYGTTKAAMGAVVRHIASRWGHEGVRANSIAPGFIPSPAMLEWAGEEGQARMLAEARSNRFGTAADVAATVAFLLSDDSAHINGQALRIDGGRTFVP